MEISNGNNKKIIVMYFTINGFYFSLMMLKTYFEWIIVNVNNGFDLFI